MNYPIYCVRCKSSTGTNNVSLARTKNNRPIAHGECQNCGTRKKKFVSKAEFQAGQQGSGILGNLLHLKDGKIPFLSDLPLIGALF